MDKYSIIKITKLISIINIIVGIFLLLPIIVGVIYHENISAFFYFDLMFIIISAFFILLFKKHSLNMTIKESILTVNLIWILLGIVGGMGLYLDSHISFASAFFEAISGFTTTGATIYTNVEILPKNVLFLRSLMHWMGGMGIIVFSIGLLSFINPSGSLTLFKSESTGISLDKLTPKIKDTAIRLWLIYLFLTILNTIFLYIGGMNFFDAINHAFATISTGGFSTKNNSLGYWKNNYFILWTTTIFMFLSGINFLAHLKIFYKDFSGYKSDEVKWYLIIFLFLSIGLSMVHIFISHDNILHAITHSFFTISSIITTTGFASTDYGLWSNAALAFIFIPMFIGANAGSTAGGVKVIRYLVLFKNLSAQIKKTLHPNAIVNIFIDHKKISNKIINGVSGFFLLYIVTNLLLSFYLFARGFDFLTAFSASIAIIGNIGPGFGYVGPADNFSIFSDFDKIILSIFMIIGRLEFYTFFIIFSKSFWKKY